MPEVMTSKIYIGTSGWNYHHWLGPFYPEKFPAAEMLKFYAQYFNTVELNNSFYHLPTVNAFKTWRETVPDNFRFAVKGSRFITHMKKLKAPKTSTNKFFARVKYLEEKAGPILFQLPPHWRLNLERLATFLERMPNKYRYACEFREHSWFTDEVYALLRHEGVALCLYQMTGWTSPQETTADFIYVRLHGTESTYGGSYPKSALSAWAELIKQWTAESKDVYFYFNNDPEGHAVKNALTLLDLVS
jgi:uncharacterized protein YecE (DUF72 family)